MKSPIRAIMPGVITFLGGVAVTMLMVFLFSSTPGRRGPPPIVEEMAAATDSAESNTSQNVQKTNLTGPVFGGDERAALDASAASELVKNNNSISLTQENLKEAPPPQVVYDLRGANSTRGAVAVNQPSKLSSGSRSNAGQTYSKANNNSPKLYKVPAPKPKPSPFITIRGAKELYRAGRLTKTEYKIMIERLELDLDRKIETLKADYRGGRLTKTEYKIAVERAKMQFKG